MHIHVVLLTVNDLFCMILLTAWKLIFGYVFNCKELQFFVDCVNACYIFVRNFIKYDSLNCKKGSLHCMEMVVFVSL